MSWRETARAFRTSWEMVFHSVEWFVGYGLEHRKLEGVEAIGIDEIHWGRGMRADNFLTVIYQIDAHCRRLLWVGKRRSQATLRKGLRILGPKVVKGLRYACGDRWKPYLQVLKSEVGHALNILARQPKPWRRLDRGDPVPVTPEYWNKLRQELAARRAKQKDIP